MKCQQIKSKDTQVIYLKTYLKNLHSVMHILLWCTRRRLHLFNKKQLLLKVIFYLCNVSRSNSLHLKSFSQNTKRESSLLKCFVRIQKIWVFSRKCSSQRMSFACSQFWVRIYPRSVDLRNIFLKVYTVSVTEQKVDKMGKIRNFLHTFHHSNLIPFSLLSPFFSLQWNNFPLYTQ